MDAFDVANCYSDKWNRNEIKANLFSIHLCNSFAPAMQIWMMTEKAKLWPPLHRSSVCVRVHNDCWWIVDATLVLWKETLCRKVLYSKRSSSLRTKALAHWIVCVRRPKIDRPMFDCIVPCCLWAIIKKSLARRFSPFPFAPAYRIQLNWRVIKRSSQVWIELIKTVWTRMRKFNLLDDCSNVSRECAKLRPCRGNQLAQESVAFGHFANICPIFKHTHTNMCHCFEMNGLMDTMC